MNLKPKIMSTYCSNQLTGKLGNHHILLTMSRFLIPTEKKLYPRTKLKEQFFFFHEVPYNIKI